MAKKLKVDKSMCVGCGACCGQFPNAFTLDADGKAEFDGELTDRDSEDVIANCPVQAISEDN